MSKFFRGSLLVILAFSVISVTASAGTFYIAANGSDSNAGTSKSAPWLHAPGMPACSANCKAHAPQPGDRYVFRGGDVWHFGNSAATPYTGGEWNMHDFWGTTSTCVDESNQSGCIYWGVDSTWYSGPSWTRPVLDGDNPLSTSLVSSCAYQTNASAFINDMVWAAPNSIFDSFEMRGLCAKTVSGARPGGDDTYLVYSGTGTAGAGMLFIINIYVHGWTATTTAGSGDNGIPVTLIGGGFNGLQTIDSIVLDGADSLAGIAAWGQYPSMYHFRRSVVRYVSDGVGQWCHDIHDNIFEFFDAPIRPTHGNILECNLDSTGDAVSQPANTPNVFYNNIVRHATTAFSVAGNVKLWFCPTKIPEYWFNNVVYDVGNGNFWDVAGPPGYSCDNSGQQFMFNNTLVDGEQPCHLGGSNLTGGQYLHVFNEHLINSPWDGLGCDGRSSATNISMSDATAISQGYATSSGRVNAQTSSVNCASESTKPCSPVLSTNATIGAGSSQQTFCSKLATYTLEPAIAVQAANACKSGTTAGCTYNVENHTVVCSSQAAIVRPLSAAWDSGAYQFSLSQAPQPPISVSVVTQ